MIPARMSAANRLVTVCALGVLFGLAGCYEVPVTGRSAMNMVSDEAVIKLSGEAFAEMKKKHRVSSNRDYQERVQRVGGRLARVAFWDVPAADWEFVVFDAPDQINAFAMAGGKVGVFTGLFKIVHNDDQLASVLAHEIAHVAAKHVNERLSQDMAIQGGGVIVSGIMSTTGTGALTSNAVQKQLKAIYQACGFKGARSHSGRRSAITALARRIGTIGGSLEDVRIFAGHAHVQTTQGYIEANPETAQKIIDLL